MSRLGRALCATTAAAALLVSLGPAYAADGSTGATRAAASGSTRTGAAPVNATRVVAISVDGLNPSAITKLGRAGAPNFYRMMNEGTSTLNARTEREQTITLPNHTGMLTGRRIDRARGGHGVTWNYDRPRSTVQRAAGHPTKSVFSVVHAAGGSTALFSSKAKFSLFRRSWPGSIDLYTERSAHNVLLPLVRKDIREQARAFTFVHLSLPDRAGHASGFMSQAYLDAVHRTDYQLGTILNTINAKPSRRNNTVVILTADHGGLGSGHSTSTALANFRVPFMVWRAAIVQKEDLYALNPDYRNPGTARTTYFGTQPVRNGDVANLAADLLGIGPVPGSIFDVAQDLDVFSATPP